MSDAAHDRPTAAPLATNGASRNGASPNGAHSNGAHSNGAHSNGASEHGAGYPTRRAADGAGAGATGDRTLHLLLRAAERGRRVGLTVMVDGVVVSGTLVGTVDYCRVLADAFASAEGGTEMDEEFADSFRTLVDDAYGMAHGDRREPADAAAFERALRFVHLTEARYVSGPTFLPPGRHGVLFRCRVADVSAWSLGDLTAT